MYNRFLWLSIIFCELQFPHIYLQRAERIIEKAGWPVSVDGVKHSKVAQGQQELIPEKACW